MFGFKCPVCAGEMGDEIADVVQAACNLAASFGVTDLAPRMEACERRNQERGRY